MTVRELVARLAKADPEDIVAIDGDSQSLFLLNQRPGMSQSLDLLEEGSASIDRDTEFLRSLRVRF